MKKDFDRYELSSPATVDLIYLKDSVRRASRLANKRLRELEKAGLQTPALKLVKRELGRDRFQESVDKMTRNKLEYNYNVLRDFLNAKSSTVKGWKDINLKRYEAAQRAGYSGTAEEFEVDVARIWSSEIESLLSSDIIYTAITEGNIDLLDKVLKHHRKLKRGLDPGKALIEMLRLRKDRRRKLEAREERKKARKRAKVLGAEK